MKYDYLIIGAGLFGSVFAQQATANGKSVLVIEKRDHIGGNCYTKDIEGINVHYYGAHIFHTSNLDIWNYVNRFVKFEPGFVPCKRCRPLDCANRFCSKSNSKTL